MVKILSTLTLCFRPLTRIHLLLTFNADFGGVVQYLRFRPLTRIHLLLTAGFIDIDELVSMFPTSDEDSSTPDRSILAGMITAQMVSDL